MKKKNIINYSNSFTYTSSKEGLRHFFLIKLLEKRKTLIGTDLEFIPVYTSTGANTGKICEKILCIIPFNGIANQINYPLGTKDPIIAPLLKMDYVQVITKHQYFYNPEEITDEHLRSLSSETLDTEKLKEFKEYKKK